METGTRIKEINPGQIYVDKGIRHRILHIHHSVAVMCEMDTDSLCFLCMPTETVFQRVEDGQAIIQEAELKKPFDIDRFKPSQREMFKKKLALVREIEELYGPSFLGLKDYSLKSGLERITKESGLSKKTVLKAVRRYLQSGLDPASLIDGRITPAAPCEKSYSTKTGMPSPAGIVVDECVRAQFDEALNEYKRNPEATIDSVYNDLMHRHYRRVVKTDKGGERPELLPLSERPTINQLRYHIRKHMTERERGIKKASYLEYINSHRLLLSDSFLGVMGPGYVFEMDQMEADFSLVSCYDPDQVVGRPIVHFMVDVYSRMIVGYSVSFDNNSLVGMTNCLLSLLEDKVSLCQRIGLVINPDVWPSGILPKIVRCDNGAEYKSESARRIFALLGIEPQLVRPGMGSMKGQVEQAFHQMNACLKPLMNGKGVIKKDPRSDHHATAKLNIDDFEKLVIQFIAAHNQAYLEGYPKTPEMVRENVRPIPAQLWAFGVKCYGSPKVIQNPVQFRFDLLKPIKATLSRRGLEYRKLFYVNLDDPDLMTDLWNTRGRRISKEVRIDPRDVGALYYLDSKGNLAVASLNLEKQGNDFRGYSLFEYEEYLKRVREMDKGAEEQERARKVELYAQQKAVIREAIKGRNAPKNTKNIHTARQAEKADRAQDYLIMKDEMEKPISMERDDESRHEDDAVSFVDVQMAAFLQKIQSGIE